LYRVVLDVFDGLVQVVFREVDAGPSRHQRERTLVTDIAAILSIFSLRLLVGAAHDDGQKSKDQQIGSGTACLARAFAKFGHRPGD